MKRIERIEVAEGVRLGVEIHGSESERPPLVLVHGFMGSAGSWGDLPERLAADRRVIVPELPGHGRSDGSGDPGRYEVPEVADLLGRMAQHLEAPEAAWLGYSMGGRIVLAGVAEGAINPRRLLLESCSPGLEEPSDRRARRAADEALAAQLESEGMEPFVDRWLGLPLFSTLPVHTLARARELRLANDPRSLAACLRGGGTGAQRSYWTDLPQIDVPTLVLTGRADRKFTDLGRRMVAALPRARLSALPEVGHAVHVEAPGDWRSEVTGWLDAVD